MVNDPALPRYVLGVDGGGSKTACLAADDRGRLIGYGSGRPTNTNYVPSREAQAALESAVDGALMEARLSGRQIDLLCISAKTVEKHRANLMQKLGLHSVSALTAFALERGLIGSQ